MSQTEASCNRGDWMLIELASGWERFLRVVHVAALMGAVAESSNFVRHSHHDIVASCLARLPSA